MDLVGSEQRVFVRLGQLWYQAVDTYSAPDDEGAMVLKELIKLCTNISGLSYARHLMEDELVLLDQWLKKLKNLIKHRPLLRKLEGKHKVHQLSHVLEVLSLWTGHLSNVESHESLNKVPYWFCWWFVSFLLGDLI